MPSSRLPGLATIPQTYPELLGAVCRGLSDGQCAIDHGCRHETGFAKVAEFPIVSRMNPILETEFRALSPAERILLVEELWDRIAAEPNAVPLTPAQRAELDRRLDGLDKNPDAGRPWSEVRDELLRR